MNIDRRGLSLLLTGVAFVLFIMFVLLAGFFSPDPHTSDIQDEQVRELATSMAQMTWWMTVALVTLPVMMLLICIAVYLFVTQDKPSLLAKTQETVKNTILHAKPQAHPQAVKVLEPSNPSDVLDLRYARGEISHDQYMSMKTNMKLGKI